VIRLAIIKYPTERAPYQVELDNGDSVYAGTLEHALIKAIQQAGIEGVELAPTLQAAEVLESLLGANE
jgi:hypothetical protein